MGALYDASMHTIRSFGEHYNLFFSFNRKAERRAILHVKVLLHNQLSRSVLLLPVRYYTMEILTINTLGPQVAQLRRTAVSVTALQNKVHMKTFKLQRRIRVRKNRSISLIPLATKVQLAILY
jgi:hypothetical protein